MLRGDSLFVSSFLCVVTFALAQMEYRTPPAQLEIIDDAVRVSIPDFLGIQNVAFNLNRNREFNNFREGEFSERIHTPTNGSWSMLVKRKFYDNDLLYVWTSVQHYGRIYQQHTPPVRVGILRKGSVCETAQTITAFGGNNYCVDQLLFEETFSGALNRSKWLKEVHHCLYTAREEFVVFSDEAKNSFISDNKLHIVPTVVEGDLKTGEINLGSKCTSYERGECQLKADAPYKVLPPVQSALLHTKNVFNFKFGRVEIRAKLPKGDWLFPYVALKSVAVYDHSEIRIAFTRGNEELTDNENRDISGRRLYGGTVYWNNTNERITDFKDIQSKQHFGDDFHVYSIIWKDNSITIAVDGETYGQVTENLLLFNQEFYIALGVSAGGQSEFKSVTTKPWRNFSSKAALKFYKACDEWSRTWREGGEELIVDYVRVYAA